MILLVGYKDDPHLDRVSTELNRRGNEYIRLDTSLFPGISFKIDLSFSNDLFNGSINICNKYISVNEIRSVFFKEIRSLSNLKNNISSNKFDYIYSESEETLYSLWQTLSFNKCLWLNDPLNMIKYSNKFYQLQIAKQLGFKIPKTIITSSLTKAIEFIRSNKNGTITKLLNSGGIIIDDEGNNYGAPTSFVDETKVKEFSYALDMVPYGFQEYILKGIDLRITIIGDTIFPVEIHSKLLDWRIDNVERLPHIEHELPIEIRHLCIKLTEQLGYGYSAIDMIKDIDGNYYFLEINSVPAWAWIEDLTTFKICSSICDLLNKNQN